MEGFRPNLCEVSARVYGWRLAFAATVFGLAVACVAQDGRSPSNQSGSATAETTAAKPQQAADGKQQKANPADGDHKKQLANDSAELLNMALALKAEVDKTTKDTLSLNVIKKADQIEKLAKSVKEKMKQSSGS